MAETTTQQSVQINPIASGMHFKFLADTMSTHALLLQHQLVVTEDLVTALRAELATANARIVELEAAAIQAEEWEWEGPAEPAGPPLDAVPLQAPVYLDAEIPASGAPV